MAARALILGVTGQDGSYLTEFLLKKDYEVIGLTRSKTSAAAVKWREIADAVGENASLIEVDYEDYRSVMDVIISVNPDEIYNLASQSSVASSFQQPIATLHINGVITLAVLEACRELMKGGQPRLFQASTSEMFGDAPSFPQNEQTPFHPLSPYACSKVYAYHQTVNHRETYGLFACNGIMFNHESPRRPERFVTRKITAAAAQIAAGQRDHVTLGNIQIGRDWGYAADYVDAMWRMLQHHEPDDYVIATNEWHTLEEFLERAFRRVGLEWRDYVRQDPALIRPLEVSRLQGDYEKTRRVLGWEPNIKFDQLIDMMVDADVQLLEANCP